MLKINRNLRTFTDFSFVFNKHPSSLDLVKKNDEEAIKQSLKNLLLTKHYERPFHPEIGCQIHGLLFENWNPITERVMQQTIIDLVNKFEPRVRLIDVAVNAQSDLNSIYITIEFQIINSPKPITLNTTLTRTR